MRDDALAVLGRGDKRSRTPTEPSPLATAIGEPTLGLDILVRRGAAARSIGDEEQAVELARQAASAARRNEGRQGLLRACLELGQALLKSPLGESFEPPFAERLDFHLSNIFDEIGVSSRAAAMAFALREVALACPAQAIVIEDVDDFEQ